MQAYVAGLNASLQEAARVSCSTRTRRGTSWPSPPCSRRASEPTAARRFARAMFLDALQKKLGKAPGRAVFDDLRAADDGESPTIGPGRFAYQLPPAAAPGSVVIDDGSSFQPAADLGGIASSREPCRVERAARRREAIEDRPPDPRRRAAGGLLLPAVLHGGRPPRGWATTPAARCFPGCRSWSSAAAPTTPGR